MKYILKIILVITLIYLGLNHFDSGLKTELVGAGIILAITLVIVDFFYYIYINRKRLKLILSLKTFLRKKDIRFSMSYLYRIKIDDKYLLVKNSNFGHYQLVGGKYKRLPITNGILQNKFNATDDKKLPNADLMKDDFAIFVPANKAISFLDWFNIGRDREISHWREFYEELIKNGILSSENFPYINYNYAGQVRTPIRQTTGWEDTYEILQYDILDVILNNNQETEMRELLKKGDSDYIKWVDEELIQNLGHDKRIKKKIFHIGEHTKWALNMKWSKV